MTSKDVWGPIEWKKGHKMAINFPNNPKNSDVTRTMQKIWKWIEELKCRECRNHALYYVLNNTPDLRDSESFQRWMFKFHNNVNKRLRKREISYREYKYIYDLN